jgi:hypothetical protein
MDIGIAALRGLARSLKWSAGAVILFAQALRLVAGSFLSSFHPVD